MQVNKVEATKTEKGWELRFHSPSSHSPILMELTPELAHTLEEQLRPNPLNIIPWGSRRTSPATGKGEEGMTCVEEYQGYDRGWVVVAVV